MKRWNKAYEIYYKNRSQTHLQIFMKYHLQVDYKHGDGMKLRGYV